jgi:hypothetical protein
MRRKCACARRPGIRAESKSEVVAGPELTWRLTQQVPVQFLSLPREQFSSKHLKMEGETHSRQEVIHTCDAPLISVLQSTVFLNHISQIPSSSSQWPRRTTSSMYCCHRVRSTLTKVPGTFARQKKGGAPGRTAEALLCPCACVSVATEQLTAMARIECSQDRDCLRLHEGGETAHSSPKPARDAQAIVAKYRRWR